LFVGTIGAASAGGTMTDVKNAVKSVQRALTGKPQPAADMVPVVVSLAEKARREGLLALEDASRGLDDAFLQRGVTLAVDGTDPEELRDILDAELYAKRMADRQGAKFFTDMGGYAPTIGIIGTVMGLVHVLENLANPEELGHLIAGAFVATLWGVLSANVLFLPIASRLKRLGDLEATRMELAIEGVMAIQAGSNPRVVAQKLRSLLSDQAEPEQEAA
jgi:chemotaxis protein MotA